MNRWSSLIPMAAWGVLLAPMWGASGEIAVSPSPCKIERGAYDCTVYVTWSTQGAAHARVFVTTLGRGQEKETEFANGRSCLEQKCPASWIKAGTNYEFTLYDYSTGSRGDVLASVGVTAVNAPGAAVEKGAFGTIHASPNPCRIQPGAAKCTSYITWHAEGVEHARVYVASEGTRAIPEKEFANSRSCVGTMCPADWIEQDTRYVFTLFDTSSADQVRVLAKVTVTADR
jgi:hypothetical protein